MSFEIIEFYFEVKEKIQYCLYGAYMKHLNTLASEVIFRNYSEQTLRCFIISLQASLTFEIKLYELFMVKECNEE